MTERALLPPILTATPAVSTTAATPAVVTAAAAVLGSAACYWLYRILSSMAPVDEKEAKMPATDIPECIPANLDSAQVFRPLRLGNSLELKNRFVRAAAFGGCTEQELMRVHGDVALGGAAMTTVAYGCVSANGRTFEAQLLLAGPGSEKTLQMLSRVAAHVHHKGAKIAIQLTHAGAFADRAVTNEVQLAPSSVFNPAGFDWPRAMSAEDMATVKRDFAAAAAAVKAAGFDAVELHAGHGYLLSQFLSPASNLRQDAYGGSMENRLRFPLEVLAAIRAAVGPDYPIVVKMNLSDGVPGGLQLPGARTCALAFAAAGADALVLSGGHVTRNGFYMLRGRTPLLSLARSLPGLLKGLAVLVFGPFFIPKLAYSPCFLAKEARVVLRDAIEAGQMKKSVKQGADGGGGGGISVVGGASGGVPCCLIGGVTSLAQAEGAVRSGFAFVQMARALIRHPGMVNDMHRALTLGNGGGDSGGDGSSDGTDVRSSSCNVQSKCTHCNECVISTLDPARGLKCPERDIEDTALGKKKNT